MPIAKGNLVNTHIEHLLSAKLSFSFLAVPAKRSHLRHGALKLSLSVFRLRLEGCPLVAVPDRGSLEASNFPSAHGFGFDKKG